MGQQASNECTCNDGFLNMCTPEDPSKEAQSTLTPTPVPGYPGAAVTGSERPGGAVNMEPSMQQGGGPSYGFADDQGAFIAAPPPQPYEDRSFSGGLPPPREPSGGAPPPQPSSARESPSPPPMVQSSASPARSAAPQVSADDILSNLEGSEEVIYSDVFTSFPGGFNGSVGLDCSALRDFLCTNSAISMDDIDMELLKVADQNDMQLKREGFLMLLREFSVSDGDSISHFMGLSADSESLAAEECRSGLLLFAQQKLMCSFSEDRWDCIFNTVMWDASVSVSMEQWLAYCKFTGRIVRLLRYAQV